MESVLHLRSLDTINSAVYFARELEFVKAELYNIIYPEYKAISFFPVSTSAGPGADTILYMQFDRTGIMKIIGSYADDLPRADVKGKEFSQVVRSLGGSYGWNIQEVRSGMLANRPLPAMKAEAGMQAYNEAVNEIGWFGDADTGLLGFLNQPNVPAGPVQVGATTGNTVWIGGSPKNNDEKLQDMNDIIIDTMVLTLGKEIPDTVLLPTEEYGHIRSKKLADGTDTVILQFFLNNHPGITVDWANELADVANPPSGAGGPLNVMAAYRRDPRKLTFELPQLFETFPVQESGLEFVVPTHARIGGVIVYYPLSIRFVEGI